MSPGTHTAKIQWVPQAGLWVPHSSLYELYLWITHTIKRGLYFTSYFQEIFPTFLSVRHQFHLKGTLRYHLKLCKNRNWCWFVSKLLCPQAPNCEEVQVAIWILLVGCSLYTAFKNLKFFNTHLKSTRTALFCFVSPFLRLPPMTFLSRGLEEPSCVQGDQHANLVWCFENFGTGLPYSFCSIC